MLSRGDTSKSNKGKGKRVRGLSENQVLKSAKIP